MVLVIDDRFWGLQDTTINQGVSAPLIGTKSKLCPACDAGNFAPLTYERPFVQNPELTANNSLANPTAPTTPDSVQALPKEQPAADGGSNITPTADGGTKPEPQSGLTKLETVIAGLGILAVMALAIGFGTKKLLHL